jgi:hypothetical protein
MVPHRGHERSGQVNAHFPVHAFLTAGRWTVGEPGMRRFREFDRPSIEGRISRDPACTIEGVNPFRQVMIVLSVPVPLQPFIVGTICFAFVHSLADP